MLQSKWALSKVLQEDRMARGPALSARGDGGPNGSLPCAVCARRRCNLAAPTLPCGAQPVMMGEPKRMEEEEE
eukprot:8642244-Pyramimonas_sp.AAC.1